MADTDGLRYIRAEVEALRKRHRARDNRASEVRAVRHGDFDAVAPNLFSDEWPRPVVANRIDVMAKHAAAALSPLPIITCSSLTTASDAARRFADKRSKIANHYLSRSRVQAQMQSGADQFYSYGMIVTSVEPDFDEMFPDVLIEDSSGFYPVWDRKGRTVKMVRVFTRPAMELCAEYPECANEIKSQFRLEDMVSGDKDLEVVKYVSATRIVMYVEKSDIVMVDAPNPLGRCTYVATRKPGLDNEIRGNFDDLIFVQLALHAMQTYTLSGAAQAVNAPFAVPNDVQNIAIGPGEIIRSNDPAQIRRVALEVPNGAWMAQDYLSKELEYGAITPEALGGSIDASVVTGKGVQQLMAGYSQQIAMAQEALVGHWEQVIRLAFQMDETFWPDSSKSIRGHSEGTPYRETYRAGRDISGDYSVDVQYGGVAGLDPNRGLVFLLQALGGDLVSKDYVRRHLPSDINPSDEESKIQVEKMRGSLVEGVSVYIQQALANAAAQGADPSDMVAKAAALTEALQKNERIEDVLAKVFPKPEPVAAPQVDPAAMMAGQGPMAAGGAPALPDQGRPDLQMLFAGLSGGGNPNLQAGVSRMIPAG